MGTCDVSGSRCWEGLAWPGSGEKQGWMLMVQYTLVLVGGLGPTSPNEPES